MELFPAELLLVHRDSEGESLDERLDEIQQALSRTEQRYVAVVPVRMTEAWLLHDEAAIRRASGNPNGTKRLQLPAIRRVEREADPKQVLRAALLDASELSGLRRHKKDRDFATMRVRTAELISDFAPLEACAAFATFLSALQTSLLEMGLIPSS